MKTIALVIFLFAASLVHGAEDRAADAASKASRAFAARDYATAEAESRRAVEAKASFAEAWVGLGLALARQQKEEDAKSAFERALQIHRARYDAKPDDSNQLVQQMFVLALLHRDAEAAELLRIGKAKFPDQPGFHISDTQIADFRKMLREEGEAQQAR